jgi:CubicO group peptidase (beta-lactamase class C family)
MTWQTGLAATLALFGMWGTPAPSFAQASDVSPETEAAIARIEADLPESLVSQLSPKRPLRAVMQADQIPAVSVAVFQNGGLLWARAWGVADTVSGIAATPATLFQAASISKPVAALGAMTMVTDGLLALDEDLNTAIEGWTPGAAITLRQLLSHSSGLGVSGFSGYATGLAIPTPLQVLNGQAPANSAKVAMEGPPGVAFSYSGGGYTATQVLMAQTAKLPFETLMAQRVLQPLGMAESLFAQPLPADRLARAASGHQNGRPLTGGANTYPELAAAGLWTTPRDLGKIGVDIQNAVIGVPSRVATPDIARQMMTPQIGGYGLGFGLETRNGQRLFKHNGLNEGFETSLVASLPASNAASAPAPNYVVVVMTNGQGGSNLAAALIRSVAREYRWAAFNPRTVREVTLSRTALARFEGLYQSEGKNVAIEMVNGVLHYRDSDWRRAPMLATSNAGFEIMNRAQTITFQRGKARDAMTALVSDAGVTTPMVRVDQPFARLGTRAPLLRGSMNNWGDGNGFVKTGTTTWALTLSLSPGTYEFKIATADWAGLNLGSRLGAATLTGDGDLGLVPLGENLRLTVTRPGTYRFTIDARDQRRASLSVKAIGS